MMSSKAPEDTSQSGSSNVPNPPAPPPQSGNPHYRPPMTTEQAVEVWRKMMVEDKQTLLNALQKDGVRITDTDIIFPAIGGDDDI